MDPVLTLVLFVIVTVIGWVVLYFIIKNAVKAALHEDRAFQRKVEHGRAEQAARRATAPHLDQDGV